MGQDEAKRSGEAGEGTEEQSQSVNVLAKIGVCLALAGWFCFLLFFVLDFICLAIVPGLLYSAPLFWFFALVVCIVILFTKKKRYLSSRSKGFAKVGFCVSVIPLGIIILFLTTSITIGWYKLMVQSSIVEINDVTSKTTQRLASNKDPHRLTCLIDILITGYIDGSATVHLSVNQEERGGDSYSINRGNVHLRIRKDWYLDECILEYEPVDVNSGSLTIRYVFHVYDD
ncbi:MAG: hypothetical protein ACYS9Y_05560 [Planctomycetota bacterium]